MTIWNDADFTQRLAHANWMSNIAVQIHFNERATGDPGREWLGSWARRWMVKNDTNVLVLGCGEGWLDPLGWSAAALPPLFHAPEARSARCQSGGRAAALHSSHTIYASCASPWPRRNRGARICLRSRGCALRWNARGYDPWQWIESRASAAAPSLKALIRAAADLARRASDPNSDAVSFP